MSQSNFFITFPEKDTANFYKAIEQISKDLGRTNTHAIRTGMRALLGSLAQSTKVSPRYRAYKKVGVSRSGKNNIYEVTTKYTTPKRKGKALRRSWQGPWREQRIYASSVSELKKRPALIIAMQGVAQESWRQAGKKGYLKINGEDTRNKKNKRIMKKAARRWVEFKSKFNENEQYVRVRNRIRHIEESMKGGRKSVDTAMERAEEGIKKMIKRTLENRARKV